MVLEGIDVTFESNGFVRAACARFVLEEDSSGAVGIEAPVAVDVAESETREETESLRVGLKGAMPATDVDNPEYPGMCDDRIFVLLNA